MNNGEFKCLLTNNTYKVNYRKYVDATYMKVEVPIMRMPKFIIHHNIKIIPLNNLISCSEYSNTPNNYIVIGSGKTGIDAVLYLLNNRVDFNNIKWIVPSDA